MNFKTPLFCEFDKYAAESYCAVHGTDPTLNIGDITKADETKVPDFNTMFGGSPCFPAGTPILTNHGYKNIEDVSLSDTVLTHTGNFRKIVRIGTTADQPIFELSAQGILPIKATPNHPFWVRTRVKGEFTAPCWKELKDIGDEDYIAVPEVVADRVVCDGWIIDKECSCVWHPVIGTKNTGESADVYNIEVETDHSYVAANAIVHNCQDFSVAGKQGGAAWTCKSCGHTYNPLEAHFSQRDKCPKCGSTQIEKTRSSLLVEWLRFLREKKPRFAIYENVKNIVGTRFRDTFDLFVKELEDYGYNVYWKVLNAKNYGIPQNRERVYCVIVRKDLDNGKFRFPDPIPLKHSLSDLLEAEVDEKYYLSDEKVAAMIAPPRNNQSVIQSERADAAQQTENTSGTWCQKTGAKLSKKGSQFDGYSDVAMTLLARDYKGFGNQQMTGVVEIAG